jgi:predicted enzyme related to lactoylglutathione lyase
MGIRYAHTNIICDDWRKLAAFYESVFECTFVPPERDQSGQWLADGTGVKDAHLNGVHMRLPGHGENGPTLEIYSYRRMENNLAPAANRKGLGHLAFSVDDVPGTAQKVITGGGAMLGDVITREIPGAGRITFAYVTDPEGNIIEVQRWD